MDQLSFASLDFAAKKKRTKRDVFLAEMAAVVPWAALEAVIEPHYRKVGSKGPAAVPARGDAARLLPTAVVQPFRSGRGRSAIRHPLHARVLRPRTRPQRNPRRCDERSRAHRRRDDGERPRRLAVFRRRRCCDQRRVHDRAAAKECAARFQVLSDGREHGFRQVVPFEQMTEV